MGQGLGQGCVLVTDPAPPPPGTRVETLMERSATLSAVLACVFLLWPVLREIRGGKDWRDAAIDFGEQATYVLGIAFGVAKGTEGLRRKREP